MVYSGAWGKLIHEKNQKQKISWHCPFKLILAFLINIKVEKLLLSHNTELKILDVYIIIFAFGLVGEQQGINNKLLH